MAQKRTRGNTQLLTFCVLLKTFQQLGYFARLDVLPKVISITVREQLKAEFDKDADDKWPSIDPLFVSKPTLYAYQAVIRRHLGVRAFDALVLNGLKAEIVKAAQIMNDTAELINVGIEWLIKERYELPGYSTLDRLAVHVKATVNHDLFKKVYESLPSP